MVSTSIEKKSQHEILALAHLVHGMMISVLFNSRFYGDDYDFPMPCGYTFKTAVLKLANRKELYERSVSGQKHNKIYIYISILPAKPIVYKYTKVKCSLICISLHLRLTFRTLLNIVSF